MADIELVQVRQRAHFGDVGGVNPVPRIYAKSRSVCAKCTLAQSRKFGGATVVVRVIRIGIRTGVKLDPRRTELRSQLDLRWLGIDKKARRNPRRTHRRNDLAHSFAVARDIQAALGRHLLARLRHEAHRVGPHTQRDLRHLRRARHFEVEPRGDSRTQLGNICILHMAAILAQMRSDATRSSGLGHEGERNYIRLHNWVSRVAHVAVTRLPQRRAVVDIEAEKNHNWRRRYGTLPRTGKRVKPQTCVFLARPAFIHALTPPMPHRTSETLPTPPTALSHQSPTTSTKNRTVRPDPKRENLLVNLVCNIAVPSLILAKLSAPERLGPALALVAALLFPLGYGLWDFAQRRTANFVSIIGLASVLLTGGLGLMQVDGFWFAVKEAAVPALIAACVWASQHSRRPLVRQFVYNEQVIDVARIDAALDAHPQTHGGSLSARARLDQLLRRAGHWLVGSFLLSAVLNFLLARWLLKSPGGSPEFNAELAKMNLLSWPVITLPSLAILLLALWRLLRGITQLTGLPLDAIFHARK